MNQWSQPPQCIYYVTNEEEIYLYIFMLCFEYAMNYIELIVIIFNPVLFSMYFYYI